MKQALLLLLLSFFGNARAQQQFTIYFDFDIAEANGPSGSKLSGWIVENSDAEILKIYGYTDSIGNPAYNIDLSERRAAYAYNELKKAGLKLDAVEEKGFGESGSFSADGAMDRKVVVYYIKPAPIEGNREPVADELKKNINNAKKGDKVVLKNLIFYPDSEITMPQSKPVLKELLTIMTDNPKLKIDIQGHMCCSVKDRTNLSGDRAETIYKFLIANGIDKTRITHHGFGTTKAIYPLPEKNEMQREANRRVEIEIIGN
jgi:outer membrane protein OmpA-like peptidoglycan-associated protein